jgi:Ribbon-helix-helix protein, copG family
MGGQRGTNGENRAETVVSVRFSSDEIARLRRLAETRGLPLSTLIRQASLATFASQPLVLSPSINEGAAGSGWILYDSRSPTVQAGSTTRPYAAVVSYRSSISTA